MFDKAKALINLPEIFHRGKLVANPIAWKTGQITVGIISGLLGSVIVACRAFGYDIPLSDEDVVNIGAAAVAIAGLVWTPAVTVSTTDKLGLAPKKRNNS